MLHHKSEIIHNIYMYKIIYCMGWVTCYKDNNEDYANKTLIALYKCIICKSWINLYSGIQDIVTSFKKISKIGTENIKHRLNNLSVFEKKKSIYQHKTFHPPFQYWGHSYSKTSEPCCQNFWSFCCISATRSALWCRSTSSV